MYEYSFERVLRAGFMLNLFKSGQTKSRLLVVVLSVILFGLKNGVIYPVFEFECCCFVKINSVLFNLLCLDLESVQSA